VDADPSERLMPLTGGFLQCRFLIAPIKWSQVVLRSSDDLLDGGYEALHPHTMGIDGSSAAAVERHRAPATQAPARTANSRVDVPELSRNWTCVGESTERLTAHQVLSVRGGMS
jgi:hypothetical protein